MTLTCGTVVWKGNVFLLLLLVSYFTTKTVDSWESGSFYSYAYMTEFGVQDGNVASSRTKVSTRLTANVSFKVISLKSDSQSLPSLLLETRLNDVLVQSTSPFETDKEFHRVPNQPDKDTFYILLRGGNTNKSASMVERLYAPKSTESLWVNIVRGIATLISYRVPEDGAAESSIKELDASGECTVHYKRSQDSNYLFKEKYDCSSTDLTNEIDGVNDALKLVRDANSAVILELVGQEHTELRTALSNERHKISAVFADNNRAHVTSKQSLSLNKKLVQSSEIEQPTDLLDFLVKRDASYRQLLLTTSDESKEPLCTKEQLRTFLNHFRSALQSDVFARVEQVSAIAFGTSMLRRFANSPDLLLVLKEEIEKGLDKLDEDIALQIIDMVIACQTRVCFGAMIKILTFNNSLYESIYERSLITISQLLQPSEFVVQFLLQASSKLGNYKDTRIDYTLFHSLAAISNKFAKQPVAQDSNLIVEVVNAIKNRFHSCSSDNCHWALLSTMRNLKWRGCFNEIYIKTVANSTFSSIAIYTALEGLQEGLDKNTVDLELERTLADLVSQKKTKYDAASRVKALEVLMERLTQPDNLNVIFSSLKYDIDILLNFVPKMRQWCSSSESIKSYCSRLKLPQHELNAVNILKQLKLEMPTCLTLSGQMMSGSSDAKEITNATEAHYSVDVISSTSGLVKRSDIKVWLESNAVEQSMLSVALYADGLENVLPGTGGGSSEDIASTENSETTAGIRFALFGIGLPPYRFFSGSAELMSAVWNAPSSLVSVLRSSVLLSDSQRQLHLSNGFILTLRSLAHASLDISGSLSTSIWSRTANALVKSSAALHHSMQVNLKTTRFNIEAVFLTEAEGFVDVTTDVNFAVQPMKTCLIMQYPDITVTRTSQLGQSFVNKRRKTPETEKVQHIVPGRSFNFGMKNSLDCSQIVVN